MERLCIPALMLVLAPILVNPELVIEGQNNEAGKDYRVDSTNHNQKILIAKDAALTQDDGAKIILHDSSILYIRAGKVNMKGSSMTLAGSSYASLAHSVSLGPQSQLRLDFLASLETYCHAPPCYFALKDSAEMAVGRQASFTTLGHLYVEPRGQLLMRRSSLLFDLGLIYVLESGKIHMERSSGLENYGSIFVSPDSILRLRPRAKVGLMKDSILGAKGTISVGVGSSLILMRNAYLSPIYANVTLSIHGMARVTVAENNSCLISVSMNVTSGSDFKLGKSETLPPGVKCQSTRKPDSTIF